MTRSRFVTYLLVLALSGLGLSVLMAAKAAGEKTTAAQPPAGPGSRLVRVLNHTTRARSAGASAATRGSSAFSTAKSSGPWAANSRALAAA